MWPWPRAYQTCSVFWARIKQGECRNNISFELIMSPTSPALLCLHITAIVLYLLADLLSSASHTKPSSLQAAHVALKLRGGILTIFLIPLTEGLRVLGKDRCSFCAPLCPADI